MVTGTSCRRSLRFCVVRVTSSSEPIGWFAVAAGAVVADCACASAIEARPASSKAAMRTLQGIESETTFIHFSCDIKAPDRSNGRTKKFGWRSHGPPPADKRSNNPKAPYIFLFACKGTICCTYRTCLVDTLYLISTCHRIYCLASLESRHAPPVALHPRVVSRESRPVSMSAGDERLNRGR